LKNREKGETHVPTSNRLDIFRGQGVPLGGCRRVCRGYNGQPARERGDGESPEKHGGGGNPREAWAGEGKALLLQRAGDGVAGSMLRKRGCLLLVGPDSHASLFWENTHKILKPTDSAPHSHSQKTFHQTQRKHTTQKGLPGKNL
jgi:hypothetical protein